MKRLNIYEALTTLPGPSTKEDIIIQVAKQQNIRFNELPQLQKDVDRGLKESLRLGFVDREGNIYKLNMEVPTMTLSGHQRMSFQRRSAVDEASKGSKLLGQGDFKRSRSLIRNFSRTKMRNSSGSVYSSMEKSAEPEQEQKDPEICSCCNADVDNEKEPNEAMSKFSGWLKDLE